MKKIVKLTVLILTLALSSYKVTAQSTSLCNGMKSIYSNLTKANFDKLPENYASKIPGWKVVIKSEDSDVYTYSMEYKIKKGDDIDVVFKKLNSQLVSCLGTKPEIEGEGPDTEAVFEYKDSVIQLYQRWSQEDQWVVLSVSR
jgi:hypothetical protein